MNIQAVMTEIATALDTIAGVRVYNHVPDSVQVPAAVVVFPENIEFDSAYGRGMDNFEVPVLVVVSKLTAKTASKSLSDYASGSGAKSVKAVLEAHTPANYDTLRVAGARVDPITFNAIDYLGVTFAVDVAGPGST